MKKINIYNKHNIIISENNLYENPNDFLKECISNNSWGKPERWVIANSEYYEESDILETEERFFNSGVINQNEDGTFTPERTSQKWVKLKAEYTIEIIDLEKDYDYLLNQCHIKRKAEYGDWTTQLEQIYDNIDEWKNRIDEIKKKYPKPIKENL